MEWYRVIKIKKGRPYAYLQRTRREGRSVRTENLYIGPAAGDGRPNRVAYHGARTTVQGALEPSDTGTFGPGLYLTERDRAETYAQYDAGLAAKIVDYEARGEPREHRPEPTYDGTVHAFDTASLNLFRMTHDKYHVVGPRLLDNGRDCVSTSDRAAINEKLAELGFDGLEITGQGRRETVIFPDAIAKLQPLPPPPEPGLPPAPTINAEYTDRVLMNLMDENNIPETFENAISPVPALRSQVETRDDIEALIERLAPYEKRSLRYYNQPIYKMGQDTLHMPSKRLFRETSDQTATQNYYGAYFHELIHWTGHPECLDRYTFPETEAEELEHEVCEEITAELGAVMLLDHYDLGTLKPGQKSQRAAYIQHHVQQLPEDRRDAILAAAKADAEKAVRFILERSRQEI